MKKKVLIIATALLLVCCAGCSQPVPVTPDRPKTDLFEAQVNSVNRAFVAENDQFTYVYLNQMLAEIDRETDGVVMYPDISLMNLIVLGDGRIISEATDYTEDMQVSRIIADDLYGKQDVLYEFKDGFVISQVLIDDFLYSYLNNMELVRTDLHSRKSDTVLTTERLAMRMLIDKTGVWYSDDLGLYFQSWEADEADCVVDELAGYFQKNGHRVFFLIHGKPGIFVYDTDTGKYDLACDRDADLFVMTEDEKSVYTVEENWRTLYRVDPATGQALNLALPCGFVSDFNIVNGQVYVLGYDRAVSSTDFDQYHVFRIEGDELCPVINEEG